MYKLWPIRVPREYESLDTLANLSAFDPEFLVRHAPDAHWVLVEGETNIVGRCSLWWSATPRFKGHRVGLTGHYAARDASAAEHLLEHALQQLADQGCSLAVGPMDGNTWRQYRLITERGQEPTFFLEPDTPDDWPGHFIDCGFRPLAHYSSALNANLRAKDARIEPLFRCLAERGVRVRPIDMAMFTEELRRIYAVSIAAFRDNFLYAPISEAEFLAHYLPIKPYIRPELVLMAEHCDELVGFLFAIPDLNESRRGQPVNTVILKTVCVLPEYRGGGLGEFLFGRCQEIAARLGFERAIHALMPEDNRSRRISGRYAATMRRYTLFAKDLSR